MKTLKLLSWNIWFDRFEQLTRWNEISSICIKLSPDVICFQEVTIKYLDYLKTMSFITDNYDSSDSTYSGDTFDGWYGTIILTKKDLHTSFSIYPFPTVMERKLLIAKIPLDDDTNESTSSSSSSSLFGMIKKVINPPTINNSKYISIATVHLESLNSQPIREKQLEICAQYLQSSSTNILCGDFNFCSYRNFGSYPPPTDSSSKPLYLDNDCLQKILPYMIDMWPVLHNSIEEKGYTFDSKVNTMIHHYEQMRYDRILYNSNFDTNTSDGNTSSRSNNSCSTAVLLEPVSIQLVGTEPITDISNIEDNNKKDLNLSSFPKPPVKKNKATTVDTNSNTTVDPVSVDNKPTTTSHTVYTTPTKTNKQSTTVARSIFPSDHFGLYAEFTVDG